MMISSSGSICRKNFSSSPPPAAPMTNTDDDTKVKKFGGYKFTEEEIKGNRTGQDGLLMMAYTCGKCESKQARTFSRHSYEQGVVLIRCESCDSLHLVADNLGWFEDDKVNIETIMKRKGENVKTNITEQGVEITKLDTTLTKEEASE